MAPPGRRRKLIFSPILLLALLFLLIAPTSAVASVLGIDLGTEYIKASLVKPRMPGEIVLTKDSRRKESAALAFKPSRSQTSEFPERLYGADALALVARFPGDVYTNLKSVLGVEHGDEVVGIYGKRHPGLEIVDGGRGQVGFKSGTFTEKDEPFVVEELLAMELKSIRANAQALAGKEWTVRDTVITLPAFYTAEEKRAVQLAAELAGLRVLSLMSDGLAVGVNYATTRTFSSVNEGGKPEFHLVFDMGAGSTTATVLRFQGRTVKDVGRFNKTVQEVQVLGTGWDRTLGGDALNEIIVDDMVTKFVDTKKMKAMNVEASYVKQHPRTMAKLWKESERLRQVLSANLDTSASFEGLFYDDVNFKYKISRADFENLASEHAVRVPQPLIQALEVAKLDIADLESVILHGGVVRTPFVQKQLEVAVGGSSKIRSNVNADESAVFGASFRGAALSPGYRVKEVRTGDTAGYTVGLKWTLEGKERQQKLFTPTSQIGAEKQVPFKTLEDTEFVLFQQIPKTDSSDLIDSEIVKIETKNLTASAAQLKDIYGCAPANISTKFSIRLNPLDGLPEVMQGTVSCEVEGPEKKGGVFDDVKGMFGFGSKKSSQDQDAFNGEEQSSKSTTSDPITSSSTTTASSSTSSSSKSAKGKDTKGKKEDPGPRTITIPIAFNSRPQGVPPLSASEHKRIRDRLIAFDAADNSRKLHEEALNTLEAFTYRARDLISDESFIIASTAKARELLEEKLHAASDWIYSEGVDATSEKVNDRLHQLKDLVDPVLKRKDEALKRPDQIKSLRDALEQTKSMMEAVRSQVEKAAEESSLSAAKASASQSASTSSLTETSSTDAAPSSSEDPDVDPLDELDSDPYASTSTSSTDTTSTPVPSAWISPYTAADLEALQSSYDAALLWLESKVAEQEKLGPSDDPVLLLKDLDTKTQEQSKAVMDLLTKKLKMPPVPPKGPKAAKSKAAKSKSTKPKSKKGKSKETDEKKDGQERGPLDGDESFEGLRVEEIVLDDDIKSERTKDRIKDEL